MTAGDSELKKALILFETRQFKSNKAYLAAQPFTKWTSGVAQWADNNPLLNLRGTLPPAPVEDQLLFLKLLEDAVNRLYRTSYPSEGEYIPFQQENERLKAPPVDDNPLAIPADYVELLTLTDYVSDLDLRGADVSGVSGVCCRTSHEAILKIVPEEIRLLPNVGKLYSEGWDISTGFELGRGRFTKPHCQPTSFCGYYYSKKTRVRRKSIELREGGWAWRVFYEDSNNKPELYPSGVSVFENLVSFLDWYGDWWIRVSELEKEWYEERIAMTALLYPKAEAGTSKRVKKRESKSRSSNRAGVDESKKRKGDDVDTDGDGADRGNDENRGNDMETLDNDHGDKKVRNSRRAEIVSLAAKSPAHSRIAAALSQYRERQVSHNSAWSKAKIAQLESSTLQEDEILDQVAFMFGLHGWQEMSQDELDLPPPQNLADILEDEILRSYIDNDGTMPPAEDSVREEYLERLKKAVNAVSRQGWVPIELPEDFTILLEMVDHVSDGMDIRRGDEPGIEGTGQFDDDSTGDFMMIQDLVKYSGFECATGWRLGRGEENSEYADLYYLYSRPLSRGEWKWRIFYGNFDPESVFEDIPAFLEWKSSWWDRMGARLPDLI